MAQTTATPSTATPQARTGGRMKFIVGGLVIMGAIVYLIVTTMQSTQQYFYTVAEMQAKGGDAVGRSLRVSGAVLGHTIQTNPDTLEISFEMANISNDPEDLEAAGGLAEALHKAATDPNASRVKVVYVGAKPDLLKNEAQAIVTGKLGADGVFYADELLLKCPTRYEEAHPERVSN